MTITAIRPRAAVPMDLARDILDAGRALHARDLLAGCDGNLSVRLADGRVAITRSGVNKSRMGVDDLCLVGARGDVITGTPSTELAMHLAVYRRCPAARAVVHAHPPTAVGFTLANPDATALPWDALPEVVLAMGVVPVVGYARPGSDALAASLARHLPDARVLLLARHGVVAWGESLDEACDGVERVEHAARMLLHARAFGGPVPLPPDETRALLSLRAALGPRTR
jgi:L-fuculose-phosphate aldolase